MNVILDDLVERDGARPAHSVLSSWTGISADFAAVAGVQRRPVEVKSANAGDD
jgi:hypothetical protein